MKIFKLFLLSLTLIGTSAFAQQFASSGMQVSFNITSINPAATFANVNKYMNSGDFKKLGISAGLYAFNANGDDPTTHVIDFYYTDIDSYQKVKSHGLLKNKTFMFTGKLVNISRSEAKNLIEQNSGSIISNVSKKLDYLIIGEKPTKKKLEIAKELKIKVINQSEWLKMLNKTS